MYKFYFRVCLLLIALLCPWTVYAAGLGKLTLNSALGQPLKAEIDLVAVKNDEVATLTASLASHEAFRQAGIAYQPFFSTFEISIEPRSNGDSYIKLSSPQLINEPYLNILVELRWASGRLMREYTVLLDPAESALLEPVAPSTINIPEVVEAQQTRESELTTPSYKEQAQIQHAPIAESAPSSQKEATYGPVSQGDTLSRIALQVSPPGVHLDQMLMALFRANRDAFIADNINLLKVGEILRIPSSNEINQISELEANAQVKVQVADWRNYQSKLAAASSEQSVREMPKHTDVGKITTTMTEETIALNRQSEEMLRLSSGEYIADDSGEYKGSSSPQDRMQMIEEDSIARNLELIEANERIAMLEKNIQNLQRLLELKDPVLAQAQFQAEATSDPESNLELAINNSEVSSSPVLRVDDGISGEELIKPLKPIANELIVNPDLSQASDDTTLQHLLLRNIEYIGGALIILLLGFLVVSKVRRGRTENEIDSDDMEFDLPPSSHNRTTAMAAAGSFALHEASDNDDMNTSGSGLNHHEISALKTDKTELSVDELDLDLTQEEKANEVVTDDELNSSADSSQETEALERGAVETDYELDLDLTQEEKTNEVVTDDELNSSADSSQETEALLSKEVADSDYEIDLDLESIEGNNNQSQSKEQQDKVKEDAAFNPDTSLVEQQELRNADNYTEQDASIDNNADDALLENPKLTDKPIPAANEIDYTFNLDLEKTADVNNFSTVADKSARASEVAEDVNSISYTVAPTEDSNAEQAVPSEQESQYEDEKTDLSVDSNDKPESSVLPLTPENAALESDAEITNANLESEEPADVMVDAENDDQSEHWQGVETKIDLAKAYIEMDDREGAKEILAEIISEGDPRQQADAKVMLGQL